jgi:cytochrome c556
MEKMSKRDEKKLLTALDKAANLSRSGLEPNHVLTKVAREFKLTPQEICRVTETYNKAKSVAFLKSASSDFRANDFPLADSDTVIKSVYEKTASETKQSTTIPMKDYAAMCSYTEVEKVAEYQGPGPNEPTVMQRIMMDIEANPERKEELIEELKEAYGIPEATVDTDDQGRVTNFKFSEITKVPSYNKTASEPWSRETALQEMATLAGKPVSYYSHPNPNDPNDVPTDDQIKGALTMMRKHYGSQQKTARESSCRRDTGSIWKEAMEFEDLQKKTRKDISDRYAATRNDLEHSMRKVAEYCESSHNKDLTKVARMLVNAYGEQGHKFVDDVNNRMSKPKLPKLEKTAHAAMFPVGEPYVSIANAFVQGQKLVKIAKDLEYFDKQADSSVIKALQMSSILKELSKGPAKIKPDFIDARTGMNPEWDNYLKALKAKKMLYNLYRFDPIIKSYPLDDVTNIYNEISDLTPTLSDNKAWMRSALRRMLTQGGAVDPFELKDMMTSEKERATTAKDYVTALSKMYDDSEKGVDNQKNINIKQETPVYL